MMPSKPVQFADIDHLAHGAIGFGGIELHLTFKANGLDDQFGKLADGQFLAGADVDMAVADLTQGRNGASPTLTGITIDDSFRAGSVEH